MRVGAGARRSLKTRQHADSCTRGMRGRPARSRSTFLRTVLGARRPAGSGSPWKSDPWSGSLAETDPVERLPRGAGFRGTTPLRGPAQWPGRSEARRLLRRLPRKEVIQPQLPLRLPCYDFTPVTGPTFDGSLLAVGPPASGVAYSRGVTGGVYKARERIHRSNADLRLLATPPSCRRVSACNPNRDAL